MDYNIYLAEAIKVSIEAGEAILSVYDSVDYTIENKIDDSPLTQADIAASNKIVEGLAHFSLPMINEELKNQDYNSRKNYDYFWIIDPLDGTKEFIKKNGEFTVNIALAHQQELILGVIYVPVTRELFFANTSEKKAFKAVLDKDHNFDKSKAVRLPEIQTNKHDQTKVRVVGSRSHMNDATEQYVAGLKKQGAEIEIVAKGSSLKFCLMAEQKADFYPRFAPTMEWDTAAGHAICNAVGLKVIDQETKKEMQYNKPNLLNNHFLVSR